MKKILVRADDLGYSEGVNYGIAKSVVDGIIRSVGVMPNMPSVEHGLKLLSGVDVCYGQHTNVCVGRPLCDPKDIPSLTKENGEFRSSKEYREAAKAGNDFVNVEEACLEIEAQYERFKELTGGEPHYFEGHAIASIHFFEALKMVAKRHDLKYMAMALDGKPAKFNHTDVYMWMGSMAPEYNPTEFLKNMVENGHDGACDVMVCHPGYLDDYILSTSSLLIPRTKEVEMACDKDLRAWLDARSDIELVTYDNL